jgi:hypothetical protein
LSNAAVFSNVLENTAVTTFRVNVCWSLFRKPYIQQAVGGKWDVKDLIGGTQEWAANQLVSMWMRKCGNEKSCHGYVVRRRGDERSFGDHVIWERR